MGKNFPCNKIVNPQYKVHLADIPREKKFNGFGFIFTSASEITLYETHSMQGVNTLQGPGVAIVQHKGIIFFGNIDHHHFTS